MDAQRLLLRLLCLYHYYFYTLFFIFFFYYSFYFFSLFLFLLLLLFLGLLFLLLLHLAAEQPRSVRTMPDKGTVIALPQKDGTTDSRTPAAAAAAAATSQPSPAAAVGGGGGGKKDVDVLVQEIKENLQLGHRVTGHSKVAGPVRRHPRASRATPYNVPPSSRISCDNGGSSAGGGGGGGGVEQPSQLRRWNHRRRYPSTCLPSNKRGGGGAGGAGDDPDDPFEMLQELISDGSLIKEAVRRLQLGLVGVEKSKEFSYNDSDDECRTPPATAAAAEYPDLCCELVGGM